MGVYNYNNNETFNVDTNNSSLDSSSNISVGASTAARSRDTKSNVIDTTTGEAKDPETMDLSEYIEVPDGCFKYDVKDGDTFESISKIYDVDIDELKKLNPDIGEELEEGQTLFIPMKDIQMTPQEVGGGSGNDSLTTDSSVGGGSGGGGSGGGGGGSSFDNDNYNDNDDPYEFEDHSKHYITDETSTESNGGAGTDPSLTTPFEVSGATSDLRNLNLNELEELSSKYSGMVDSLLKENNYTREELGLLLNAAYAWFTEEGLSIGDKDIYDIIELYLAANPDAKYISKEDVESIYSLLAVISEINQEIASRTGEYSEGENGDIFASFVVKMFEHLGYTEEQTESMSLIQKLNIISENMDDLNTYVSEEAFLPPGYGVEAIVLSYVSNSLISLIPQTDDFNGQEVLKNYIDLSKDILREIGVSEEELKSDNIFTLANLLISNVNAVNKLFNKYGLNFNSEFGITQLVSSPMASVAYSMISESKDLFIQYMDANAYSDGICRQALAAYEKGNVASAIYILQLEDLKTEEIDNDNRMDEIMDILNDGPIFEDEDEFGRNFYGQVCNVLDLGAFEFDSFIEEYNSFMTRFNELKTKVNAGETLNDLERQEWIDYNSGKYDFLFEEQCIEVINLYNEYISLQSRQKEMDSLKYQTELAIKYNSFEYVDRLAKSDEYKDAVNGEFNVTYNEVIDNAWNTLLDSYGDNPSNFGYYLSDYFLNIFYKSSLDSPIEDMFTDVKEMIAEGYDEIDIADEMRRQFNLVYSGSCFSGVESIEVTDDKITVLLPFEYGTDRVKVEYDIKNDSYMYYVVDSKGNEITKTDNLKRLSSFNYFEAFEKIMELPEYKGLSRKEAMDKAFEFYADDIQPGDEFWVAQMCYEYFTDDQIKNYYYLYEVEGPERANEYLSVMRDSIHQQIGMELALDDIEYIMNGSKGLRTFAVGLQNGLVGWIDNVRTLLDRDTIMTPTEYEQKYLLEVLQSFATPIDPADVRGKLSSEAYSKLCSMESPSFLDYYYLSGKISESQYNNLTNDADYIELKEYAKAHPKVINYSYMIGQNVGNMLPSIMASIMCAPLGSVSIAGHAISFGKAAACITMFAGCWGGAYKEAIRAGKKGWKVETYAFLKATSEVATEYFLGRMPGIGRLTKSLNPVIGQTFLQKLAMVGINLLKDVGGELAEESLQIWIDYALNSALLGETIDLSKWPQEQLDTAIVTVATTLILGLPAAGVSLFKSYPIKIDRTTTMELTLQEIMELNKLYVNEETGDVDIDGIKQYVTNKIEAAKVTLSSAIANCDIDTVTQLVNKLSNNEIGNFIVSNPTSEVLEMLFLAPVSQEKKVGILEGIAANFSVNKAVDNALLSLFTFQDQMYIVSRLDNELRRETIENLVDSWMDNGIIERSLTSNEIKVDFDALRLTHPDYEEADFIRCLAAMYPNSDIYNQDGGIAYLREYDVVLYDLISTTSRDYGNQSINEILNMDLVAKIDEMAKAGKYTRTQLLDFIDTLRYVKGVVESTTVIGYDSTIDHWPAVDALGKIFGDNSRISSDVNLQIENRVFNLDDIKNNLRNNGFTEDEINNFFNNTRAGQYLSLLTPEELEAIRAYSLGSYYEVNSYLRGQKTDATYEAYAKAIQSAMAKYQLTDTLFLYRGDTEEFGLCDEFLTAMIGDYRAFSNPNEVAAAFHSAIGRTITTKNFLSTSPAFNASFAKSGSVVLEILAPPGTAGAYINLMSSFYNSENEYLLADNANLTILNSYVGTDGKVHVQMVVNNGVIESSDGGSITTTRNLSSLALSSDEATAIQINYEVNDAMKNSSFETTGFDTLTTIIGNYRDNNITVPANAIVDVINRNQDLRRSIVAGATEEIRMMLEDMYDYHGEELDKMVSQVVNDLVGGEAFINGHVGDGTNWQHFIDTMRDRFIANVKAMVATGKAPILWSGIKDENHSKMNEKFTTIENTTIGEGLIFLDTLYPNWNKTGSPQLESLWGMLSQVFADAINELVDPATNSHFTNIPFVYPNTISIDDCFGNLFKTVEFPTLLRNGNVKTITMVQVNQETMDITGTIEVDITDIVAYYKQWYVEGVNNPVLNEQVLNMLVAKIKNDQYVTVDPSDSAALHPVTPQDREQLINNLLTVLRNVEDKRALEEGESAYDFESALETNITNYDDDTVAVLQRVFDLVVESRELTDEQKAQIAALGLNPSLTPKEIIETVRSIVPTQQLEEFARRMHISPEFAQTKLNQMLARILGENNFAYKCTLENLLSILDSGSIKSGHETGTTSLGTGDSSYFIARRILEELVFGVDIDADPASKPVYGLVLPPLDSLEAAKYYLEGPGCDIGADISSDTPQCIVIFDKSKVAGSTTFTNGDSLNYFSGVTASSVESPTMSGTYPGMLDNIENYSDIATISLEELYSGENSDHYLEIQLHGAESHSTENIQEIIFVDKAPSEDVIAALSEKGIKFEVLLRAKPNEAVAEYYRSKGITYSYVTTEYVLGPNGIPVMENGKPLTREVFYKVEN